MTQLPSSPSLWRARGRPVLKGIPASNIKYTYDAKGNRIGQLVTSNGTWYVRDAQGNIMSTYTAEENATDLESLKLSQGEKFLYGSSRLGLITVKESVEGGPDYTPDYVGRPFTFAEQGGTAG